MARSDVTSEFLAQIESGIIRPAFLVEANFTSGPLYVWTGRGNLSAVGHTFTGVGTLGSISSIEEGSDVEARGIVLTMSGIDATLLADVLNEFQVGLPATVWLALFDESNVLVPNPVISFAGRMDQPTLEVGGETAAISINCENRLLDMNVSTERRYTVEDQQRDHPGDHGFDFVNSIQEVTIYWGRTPNSTNNL